jgi:glucokinase
MRDLRLYSEARNAAAALRQKYQSGAYRVIRDPEGVVSLWLVEGLEHSPFSLQFANRGRISGDINDMPPEFARAFLDYVRKTLKG